MIKNIFLVLLLISGLCLIFAIFKEISYHKELVSHSSEVMNSIYSIQLNNRGKMIYITVEQSIQRDIYSRNKWIFVIVTFLIGLIYTKLDDVKKYLKD